MHPKAMREITLPRTKGVKSPGGFQTNGRFQGSVQAKKALEITIYLANVPRSLLGKPTRTIKTHPRANRQMLKGHWLVVGAHRAVGTLRQSLPPRPSLIPIATLGLCTRDTPPSLVLAASLLLHCPCPLVCNPEAWNTGSLGSTAGSLPQLSAGPAVS